MQEPSESEILGRLVAGRGIAVRPYEVLLGALRGEGLEFDEIVRRTTLPRRAVEEALAALGEDVETVAGRVRWRDAREAAPVVGIGANADEGGPLPPGLVERIDELIRLAPRPKHELDHVAATAETVARRAVVLHRTYALARRRVLLVGDRDLTSLALAIVDPTTEIAVVDIDDAVLAHIDDQPEARRAGIRCYFADLRQGLAGPVRGWADLAVTDPPYTPEGIALFVQRGLEGLSDLGTGRLALAYGYGDQPKLGLKVQDALHNLRLVYEAVLPAFNRYVGAQAIGSASNLYLLRATSDTKRDLPRRAAHTTNATSSWRANLYTHGPQSLEADPDSLAPETRAALRDVAAGPDDRSVSWISRWSDIASAQNQDPERAAMADLRHDPGPLLVRVLLAVRAPRVAVLVRNQHPGITSAAAQHALQATVGDKYAVRFRRSFPDPQSAIVEAVLVPPVGSGAAADRPALVARRHVLDRPHGKLGNVGREALIAASGGVVTKNAARTAIATALADVDLQASLLDLPRHTIDHVLDALTTTADQLVERLLNPPTADTTDPSTPAH
jgi:hypothetical protein